jgi:hypothetical protein
MSHGLQLPIVLVRRMPLLLAWSSSEHRQQPCAPAAKSGLGVRSPLPWAASATGSGESPPPVAPLPPKPWDAGVTFGFIALQHASRDQKAYAKTGKEKEKICKKNVWHTTKRSRSACKGAGATRPCSGSRRLNHHLQIQHHVRSPTGVRLHHGGTTVDGTVRSSHCSDLNSLL